MQHQMKYHADKHRSEREFQVGDAVFLKLQPYEQTSVHRRANHKLSFKYYGPYSVLQRVGAVAHKLALPPSSHIHPVFHVSQLRPCLKPGHQVLPQLPNPDPLFQVPVRLLLLRVRQQGHSRWLKYWCSGVVTLKQRLPRRIWTAYNSSLH
uniref:Uncharacterized protein n=1 Tax=Avena sativa TaxID=4498 RepID=A0ACD5Z0W0_AVESA